MPTTLVTGGAGFIGSHVVDALLARGEHVVVLDNFDDFYSPALKRHSAQRWSGQPNVTLVEGDLLDASTLERAFDAAGEGAGVIHLAARAGVRPSIDKPALYARLNVEGTVVMLEAARRRKIRRFVFASSSSVYGARSNPPFNEADRIDRPVSPYAATKAAGEALCATWHHLYALPVVALRFFTVYGPRQRPDLAIAKFSKQILRGEPILMFGDGTMARDYTYVDDTVRGVLAALDTALPGFEAINLGGLNPVPLATLIASLEEALGKKALVERRPEQPGDVPLTCADTKKAEQLLGFKARHSLKDGLSRWAAWLRTADAAAWAT